MFENKIEFFFMLILSLLFRATRLTVHQREVMHNMVNAGL